MANVFTNINKTNKHVSRSCLGSDKYSVHTGIKGLGCYGSNQIQLQYLLQLNCWLILAINSNQCLSPLTLWVRTPLRRGTTLCETVCQWLATGRWFSPGTLFSFTNKTDRQYNTEILLKVTLNTMTITTTITHQLHHTVNTFLSDPIVTPKRRTSIQEQFRLLIFG